MIVRCIWLLISAMLVCAQQAPQPPTILAPQAPPQPTVEQQELMRSMADANSSAIDIVRVLEAHLKKYPKSPELTEIERVLANASMEIQDDRRIALYAPGVLAATPENIPLLDRVARSLLALGGRENAEKALAYAQTLEGIILREPSPEGREVARRQDERDKAMARTLLYESRAQTALGEKQEAVERAAKSFAVLPTEEAAREWSEALSRAGHDNEAIARMADAFAIPDARATDADRAADRRRLAETYRKLHGSEKGLGDEVLAAYDRSTAALEDRRKRLQKLDANWAETDAMQFGLTGVDGNKLLLASLKGRVLVMDFWATWCVPCRTQHPLYEQVKQRFADRSDVVFLSIDTDEDRQPVSPFLEEQNWSRAVYFEDGLQRLLQVSNIPTTVLFDKRGRVASRMNGFVPEEFVEQLTDRIKTALEAP